MLNSSQTLKTVEILKLLDNISVYINRWHKGVCVYEKTYGTYFDNALYA